MILKKSGKEVSGGVNGLKKQDWFVSNLSVWLLCTNEDSDDPGDFEEEDLVEYFGIKAA